MRAFRFLSIVLVVGLLATQGFAQIVASLDNEGLFVLNGDGEELLGVDIMSPVSYTHLTLPTTPYV